MWDAEPRIMIKACPICSASSQMKLIWADFLASTDAHWFETPTPIPKGRGRTLLLWIVFFFYVYNLSNPRKEVAASWSQRRVSCVSCARYELMMSTHVLYVYVRTHVHKACSHTHTHTHTHTSHQCKPSSMTQTLCGGV